VEQANAAYKLAEAELVKAQAAVQDAIAEQNKALAENQKLQNELLAIQNDSAKAELEKQLAKNEMELDSLQKAHEEAMYTIQTTLAKAKRSYELALAQIEIAKAINSENGGVTIFKLENDVTTAKTALDTAEAEFNAATQELWAAQADARYNTVNLKRYELSLAKAKADLEIKNATLAKWNAFAEEDETADWRAEIAEIEDSLVQIGKAKAKVELEKQQALNSKDFKAYVDTVYATEKALALEKDTLKNKFYFAEAVTDTMLYTTIWKSAGEQDKVFEVYKNLNKSEAVDKLAGVGYMKFNSDSTAVTIADEYGKDAVITLLDKEKSSYTTEKIYWLKKIAANDSARLAGIKADADSAIVYWQRALEAYGKTTPADSLTKWEEDAKEAADDFATAIDEAESATDSTAAAAAYKTALLKWYDGAKKNGMTLGKVAFSEKKPLDDMSGFVTVWTTADVYTLLSDATNGTANLFKILDSKYNDNSVAKIKYGDYFVASASATETEIEFTGTNGKEASVKIHLGSAITKDADNTYYKKLVEASNLAFGEAEQYVDYNKEIVALQKDYLHTQPTAADAKYVGYNNAGAYGTYLASLDKDMQFVANNYEAIIADLEAAKTKWIAVVNEIVVEAENATADIKAAKAALKLAQDNLNAYSDGITETQNLALYELGGEERALKAIKDALITAVEAFIGDQTVYTDKTGFAQWLAGKVNDAQEAVFNAETNVIARENDLAKMTEGYDARTLGVELAEERLADATEALSEAQADLDEALANLAKGLEILAATNGVSAE